MSNVFLGYYADSFKRNFIIYSLLKLLKCKDVGYNCHIMIKGDDEDDVILNAKNHALKEHNLEEKDFTPEFKEKIRRLITSAL